MKPHSTGRLLLATVRSCESNPDGLATWYAVVEDCKFFVFGYCRNISPMDMKAIGQLLQRFTPSPLLLCYNANLLVSNWFRFACCGFAGVLQDNSTCKVGG